MFKQVIGKEEKSRNPWIKPHGSAGSGIAQLQCKTGEETGLRTSLQRTKIVSGQSTKKGEENCLIFIFWGK